MKLTTTILAVAAVLGVLPARALADDPPALETLPRCFSPAPMPATPKPTRETTTFQPIYVDIAFLETLNAGEWFAINASPTRTFAARVETVERRARECGSTELALSMADPDTALKNFYLKRGYRFVEFWKWPYTNYTSAILSKIL